MNFIFVTGLVDPLESLDAIEIKAGDLHFDDHPVTRELPDDLHLPGSGCRPLDRDQFVTCQAETALLFLPLDILLKMLPLV